MKIKPFILRALLRMGGNPMTDETVFDTVNTAFGFTPRAEVKNTLRELEAAALVSGAKNELLDSISWTLTEKGRHAALQLS